mmetsp:Transcript_8700/g.26125  ORF Transcript_8700/g.26125 Transcript_8700/m.26125 type:complete len:763 (+) Transcript_8700:2-2290(+)
MDQSLADAAGGRMARDRGSASSVASAAAAAPATQSLPLTGGKRRMNGELHAAIKKKDVNKVRSMLTGSFEDSLEACFRSRMTAAPKLYAQIGYKTFWHLNTPWWLCTPLQYAAIYDTVGEVTTLLLRAGADVNNCGSLQASPLHIAAATKNKQFIICLMNSRTPNSMHVDLEIEDVCDRTADMVSKDAEVCELIKQLRDGNSESTKTEWQMVEITSKDASTEDTPEARHDAICTCMLCQVKRKEDGGAAVRTPSYSSVAESQDSESAEGTDNGFLSRSAEKFSKMVSKMFPPSKFSLAKQPQAGDDPIFRERVVTFCLIDFDDLELDKHRIAGGSFGDVYRGTWKGYTVAVKMLRHVDFNDEEEGRLKCDMLLQEIRMFEELRHVNIIGFYGASIERIAGKLYFCTEFATNGSLYDFLHNKRSAVYLPETVSRWAIEIASGMEYLSEKNILHRDLKSANILLTKVGLVSTMVSQATSPEPTDEGESTPVEDHIRHDSVKVLDCPPVARAIPEDRPDSPTEDDSSVLICKICDFGLSHKVSKPKGSTVGTVRWMAPEALKRSEITLKSDVYSFGVVLWEMVARRKPWRDFTDLQVIWAVAELDERLKIPDGFPPYITAILNECWRVEPKDRPAWADLIPALSAVDTKESWPLLDPDPAAPGEVVAGDVSFGTIGASDCSSFGSGGSAGGSIAYSQELWSKDIDVAARSILSRLQSLDMPAVDEGASQPPSEDTGAPAAALAELLHADDRELDLGAIEGTDPPH